MKTLQERFNDKYIEQNLCWVWQAAVGHDGYGLFRVDDKLKRAHRVSYEVHVGPIPKGLHIDHLCRNRLCVNPEHLEPVTQQENTRRAKEARTHCVNGHPYNIYGRMWGKINTYRYCIQCNRIKTRKFRAKQRLAKESET